MTGFASGRNFNKPARKLSLKLHLGDSHRSNHMKIICQPISLSVFMSVYLSFSLSIRLTVYLSVRPSVFLSISQSLYLSV